MRAVTYDGLVERYKEMYLEIKKQNNMKTFKDLNLNHTLVVGRWLE
jgi:hypothetical protein